MENRTVNPEASNDMLKSMRAAVEMEEALAELRTTVETADIEQIANDLREVGQPPNATRPLTDVEEKWFRMKHPEMKRREQDRIIAKGLPADTEPITRADLPSQISEPHAFTRTEWRKRKKARKTAARQRAKARR